MCGCSKKHSNLCVDKINTKCATCDGDRGNNSKIETACANQFSINEDIYSIIDDIKEDTIGEETVPNCIEYTDESLIGKVTTHGEKICSNKSAIEELQLESICDKSIEACNIDLMGLVDSCGNQPENMGELLQIIITKIQS